MLSGVILSEINCAAAAVAETANTHSGKGIYQRRIHGAMAVWDSLALRWDSDGIDDVADRDLGRHQQSSTFLSFRWDTDNIGWKGISLCIGQGNR